MAAQFACTTMWFAGNAVINKFLQEFHLSTRVLAHITSAVQFGFIAGTLVFALFTITDRISPSKVFFISAIAGSLCNLAMLFSTNLQSLIVSRALTGFCLAGIYPVGMKLAADHYQKGLGKALGFLVGALVLGTSFPHLLTSFSQTLSWRGVIITTSLLSLFGGFIIFLLVPDGPYRTKLQRFDFKVVMRVFNKSSFRSAAFGYFGHMWELYTYWAFVPLIIIANFKQNEFDGNVSIWTFATIAAGAVTCVLGGYLSQIIGSAKTAFIALTLSCICCLLSPLMFWFNVPLLIVFIIIWGMAITADSPQFSALVASTTNSDSKGTALTIVNGIGFAISIVSIQIFNVLLQVMPLQYVFLILALGPMFGLYSMRTLISKNAIEN